jgi:hypothetical protein
MNVEFSKPAREELIASIEYYDSQEPGLGQAFFARVEETIHRIQDFPAEWTPLDNTFHRCLVNQFPYALIYTTKTGKLLIASVMNLHRKPDYWRKR